MRRDDVEEGVLVIISKEDENKVLVEKYGARQREEFIKIGT